MFPRFMNQNLSRKHNVMLLVHLICWLNEKEEDNNLSRNISMLKIQNFNTYEPTICSGTRKYIRSHRTLFGTGFIFPHLFIPSSSPRAEINIRLSEIKKTVCKNLLVYTSGLVYPQLVAS